MDELEKSKKLAAEKALEFIEDGMILGLGTGSTAEHVLQGLSELIAKSKIKIVGIPTSQRTENLAKKLKIPLSSLDEYQEIDLCIDGADQIDSNFNMIKGGGGAHTREKIIATASKRYVVVVDYTKIVKNLNREVPIEVLKFARGFVEKKLLKMKGTSILRKNFTTDNGNIILDTKFSSINPGDLEPKINSIPGVLENGIFSMRKPEQVIIGYSDRVEIKERKGNI